MPSSANHTPDDEVVSFGQWFGEHFLFSTILETDVRTPCMTFSIPAFLLRLFRMEEEASGNNEFGLLAPSIEFWTALIMTLLLGVVFNSIMSCIIYEFMVLPRKKNKMQDGKRPANGSSSSSSSSSMTPFLIGFGIIMPLCSIFPFYANRYFCIKNKIMKFLNGTAQLTTFFRCSEAMFGFLPSGVDGSLTNLIIYNAFPVEVKFESGPIKSTWANVRYYFVNWVKSILVLGLYSSVLDAYNHEPYPSEEGPALRDVNIFAGFSPRQLVNNFSVAILFQVYLSSFGFGLNFLTSLCGVTQVPMMLNPIFESSSPSDFWGRRWNLVVHGILKRGVYKPVRTKYSRLAASTATFVASGLFHEWLLAVVFYSDSDEQDVAEECTAPNCYIPGYGRNTLFFVWNAIVIGFEYAIGGAAIFQLFKKHLPLTLVSLMVASTALPMAHWFTNDYVRSDFFNDGQIGFPLIVRMD